MDSDDLQKLWRSETERLVARSEARIERRLEVRSALGRFWAYLIFELVVSLGAAALVGAFIASAWHGPWAALAGALVLASGLAQVAASVVQFRLLEGIDRGSPVVEVQKRLERLTELRLRILKASFVIGLACWAGLMAVIAAVIFASESTDSGQRWWAGLNLAIALGFIPAFLWVSRQRQWFVRLRAELAGTSLMQARAALEALSNFEREPG